MISIIIPFRDEAKMLMQCVESVVRKTVGAEYEIILVDNQSQEIQTEKFLAEFVQKYSDLVKVLKYDKPFNYAAINNFAVAKANGEYIVFLNNDTEVIADDWLVHMQSALDMDGVGAVGAKLLYANKTIQHAGVEIINGDVSHVYAGLQNNDDSDAVFNVQRSVVAVTAACMMMRKDVFQKMGGFDAENFGIAYNDVDLCLQLREIGLRVMYEPGAVLYHYESVTRGRDVWKRYTHPGRYRQFLVERAFLRNKWRGKYFFGDENDKLPSIGRMLVRKVFKFFTKFVSGVKN